MFMVSFRPSTSQGVLFRVSRVPAKSCRNDYEYYPFLCESSRIVACGEDKVSDFGYANDTVLPSEDPVRSLVIVDRLNDGVAELGMSVESSKFKKLLEDYIGSNPNVIFAFEDLGKVDRFCCLSSLVSSSDRVSEKVFLSAENSAGGCHFEVSVALVWHPVID